MSNEDAALQIISRFGLPLGVGDKSIDDVCRECGIETGTFLAVINYAVGALRAEEISASHVDIPTVMIYLNNAHSYFLDFLFPRTRQELIEAISAVKTGSSIPLLIIRLYDDYVAEAKVHIAHENANEFEKHADDDEHLAVKMRELKNLIIKYYPSDQQNGLLYSALADIYAIEKEMALHCAIEDNILLPALMERNTVADKAELLSDREKDVLVQVVKGLSNKEIADVLCISQHTVISHRKNIARKLNIRSTAGLTIYAIVNGLITINDSVNV